MKNQHDQQAARGGRDSRLELLRLLACFGILVLHLGTPSLNTNGTVDVPSLILWSLGTDGIAMFFVLTGCFLFSSGKSWGTVLVRYAGKVLTPTLLMVLCFACFGGWFYSPEMRLSPDQIKIPELSGLLQGLVKWDAAPWTEDLGHLWYIFSYGSALLLYPLVCAGLKQSPKAVAVLAGLSVLRLMMETAAFFIPELSAWIPLSGSSVSLLQGPVVMMLLGHFLWQHRERMKGIRWAALGGVLAVTGSLTRAWTVGNFGLLTEADTTVLQNWWSVFTLLDVTGFFMIALQLKPGERTGRVICTMASWTMSVYLLHFPLKVKLMNMNVFYTLRNSLDHLTGIPALDRPLCDLLITVPAFVICAFPAIVWKPVKRKLMLLKMRR